MVIHATVTTGAGVDGGPSKPSDVVEETVVCLLGNDVSFREGEVDVGVEGLVATAEAVVADAAHWFRRAVS